jgi:glucosamine-phosphate N-acetyltransferase
MPNYNYTSLTKIIQYNKEHLQHMENIKSKYMGLLWHLTKLASITVEEFIWKIESIARMGEIMICFYLDDEKEIHIVGSGTIIFEPKLIHGCRSVGHIEDIIVQPSHRGKGIATGLLNVLNQLAIEHGCYKTILDCKPELEELYVKSGFEKNGIQMSKYF